MPDSFDKVVNIPPEISIKMTSVRYRLLLPIVYLTSHTFQEAPSDPTSTN